MSKPQAPKNVKPPEPAGSSNGAAASPQTVNSHRQLGSYEEAMKLFHARKLQEARDLFAIAAVGPERDVAQRARLHISMCDRRLQQPAVVLASVEEYYSYGIAMINVRKLPEARSALEKAVEMAPGKEHIHYALALAQALSGDSSNAFQNLKRAIELEPRNRVIARQDADFAPLAHQAPFDSLLYPEKKNW